MNFVKRNMMAVAAAALAFAPMAASPINMFAKEVSGTTTSSETTNLNYVVEGSYAWTIHSDIDFGKNKGINSHSAVEAQKVQVTKNIIPEGMKLNIKMKGSGTNGAYTITNGSSEVLNYHVNNGGAQDIAVDGTVLDVAAGTNTGSTSLKYTLDTTTKNAEVAGTYNGTATFTASVVSAK